jgi:hypothetical protein
LVASGGTWLMEEVDLSTSATNCYLFNISNDPFKSEQEMNYDFLMRMMVVAVMSLELLLSGIRLRTNTNVSGKWLFFCQHYSSSSTFFNKRISLPQAKLLTCSEVDLHSKK